MTLWNPLFYSRAGYCNIEPGKRVGATKPWRRSGRLRHGRMRKLEKKTFSGFVSGGRGKEAEWRR